MDEKQIRTSIKGALSSFVYRSNPYKDDNAKNLLMRFIEKKPHFSNYILKDIEYFLKISFKNLLKRKNRKIK